VVEKDEKEKSVRKILNFGHTFGHAYEASLGYSKKLNHGEAVLLGIFTALKFCWKNKILKSEDYFLIINHIKNSGLPHNLKTHFSLRDLDKILAFMKKDKKNYSNKVNLILLKKIGYPLFNKSYDINNLKIFLKKELS